MSEKKKTPQEIIELRNALKREQTLNYLKPIHQQDPTLAARLRDFEEKYERPSTSRGLGLIEKPDEEEAKRIQEENKGYESLNKRRRNMEDNFKYVAEVETKLQELPENLNDSLDDLHLNAAGNKRIKAEPKEEPHDYDDIHLKYNFDNHQHRPIDLPILNKADEVFFLNFLIFFILKILIKTFY